MWGSPKNPYQTRRAWYTWGRNPTPIFHFFFLLLRFLFYIQLSVGKPADSWLLRIQRFPARSLTTYSLLCARWANIPPSTPQIRVFNVVRGWTNAQTVRPSLEMTSLPVKGGSKLFILFFKQTINIYLFFDTLLLKVKKWFVVSLTPDLSIKTICHPYFYYNGCLHSFKSSNSFSKW